MSDERKTKAQLIAELSTLRQRTAQLERERSVGHELSTQMGLSQAADVLGRVSDGFVALDNNWRYTYVNQRAAEMLNRHKPEDLIGKHIWTEYPEGVGQPFHLAYEKALAEQQTIVLEDYYQPWERWFENRIYPSPDGLTIYFTEITDRKRAENELRKKNRALTTLSTCNQALVHLADELELLNEICRICIEIGGYRLAWVGYAEQDEQKTVRPVAQHGFENGYLDTVNITWADTERGRGPTGTAIRTRQICIARNILANPDYAPWRAAAIQHGYAASIALPLIVDDQVWGALNIYAADLDAFDAEEVKLLQELSSDLAYGIASLRTRAEHARVEEAQRASEERLRLTLDQANAILWTVDRDLRFTAGYGGGLTTLDLKPGQTAGMSLYQYFQADDPAFPAIAAHYRALQGESVQFEQTWGGITFQTLLEPQRNADGTIIGVTGIAFDVHERKRVEDALKVSEARYRLISTVASDYMFSTRLGAEGELVLDWVAGAFEAMTEYTFEEYIAHGGWRAALHPDDVAVDDRDMDKLRRNQPIITELRTLTKSGKTVWVRVYAHPVWDENRNELVGIYGAVQNITERKQAEEALKRSEEKFSKIFHASPVPISISRIADGRYLDANDSFLQAMGYGREEVIGHTAIELGTWADPADRAQVAQILREQGSLHNFEGRYRTKSGQIGYSLASAEIIELGEEPCILGVTIDITPLKQAEAEIRQLNAELEQRVAERTDELSRSNEQLRVKNEELKAFAYTVSHDLKAPLRGIAGYAQELDRRHRAGLSDRAQFCVSQIITASHNLDRLIEDLLHYSRLDAETPTVTGVNVRELIDAILSDRRPLILERDIQVSIDLPFNTIHCWERGLTQVLTNLIDNAIKYSRHAAPPKITITGEELVHAYRLRIGDNGIGFDMKYHDRIYGLFNRLVRQSEFEGTGAGLAIARKALDKQGGRIWAESQLGAGAVFFVELPKVSTTRLPGNHV